MRAKVESGIWDKDGNILRQFDLYLMELGFQSLLDYQWKIYS